MKFNICFSLILIIILFYNCDGNSIDLDDVFSHMPSDSLLEISTYDSSNQVVHPDILLSNDIFYLAITPYPYSNDYYENPCLYSSTDGMNFLSCVSNPLVPTPLYDHNCDPDIFMDDNKICICYLETMRPDSNNVILLQETKSLTFNKSTIVHYDTQAGDKIILSPSIVRDQNQYFMFYMYDYKIEYLTSTDLHSWDKSNPQVINISLPDSYRCWHVDVFKAQDAEEYCMLLHGYDGPYAYSITYATSTNLTDWNIMGVVVNKDNIPDENARYVYRSTGIVNGNTLVVWYSYRTFDNKWKLGLKKVDLTTLTN